MKHEPRELIAAIHAWDKAMIENDAGKIGAFMSEDWSIIGPDGSISGKEAFLGLVGSGKLTHNVMESHDIQIRIYGEAAIVIARGISGGAFDGQEFYLRERVSCVFIRQESGWICVSTHLSNLPDL